MYRLVITEKKDDRILLNKEQTHYLKKVLRLKTGYRFIAMDGKGKSWLAEIIAEREAKIIESILISTELPIKITLIVALPKGNGFDEIVRSCTELGVTTFMPVISDRTIIKPSQQKILRWQKIATEAAEQSERQIVPQITNPNKFTTVLEGLGDRETDCYICVARSDRHSLLKCLEGNKSKKIAIATGPEGGFTAKEVEFAIAAGFKPVSLGNRILRAITAPVAAMSLVAAVAETNKIITEN
ncbi:MAG: 16S rRNA (uracil(1498)-N(3))-methyltransferase [Prochloraceae cyanobacterium]